MAKREEGTRNANGAGTIKEREAKSGMRYDAVYSYKDAASGKAKRGTKTFTKKSEALKFLQENARNHNKGMTIATGRQTVATFLPKWLADQAETEIRPSTAKSYKSKIDLYIIPALGDHKLTELTANHVNQMTKALLQRKLSPRTVFYARAVLRAALNDALREGLVTRNVVSLSQAVKQKSHKAVALAPEAAQSFLRSVKGDRLEALYVLLISTGMRVGEARGLQWKNVDLLKGTIAIEATLEWLPKSEPKLASTKTDRSTRTLEIADELIATLKNHKSQQETERIAAGNGWESKYPDLNDLVFTNLAGDPISYNTVYSQFQRHLTKAGLPKMRIHDLRHTFVSLMASTNTPILTISRVVGHINTNLTMNTYSHLFSEAQREAMRGVESLLSNGG